MTYYGGKELAASFRTVRNNTIQIAEEIPEESYSFRPSPDSRSIGQTLAHIATVTGFQTYMHPEPHRQPRESELPGISPEIAG